MKPVTSNLASRWGLPRPIIKFHAEEKWAWPWVRGAPQNWGFPFNKPAMIEGSDFKIGSLAGFAKVHHKILSRRKGGRGPGLGKLPKIWGFPFNIYAMAETIDFIFWYTVSVAN